MPNPVSSSPAPSGRIPSLDGLRAIAILLVMVGHGWYSLPLVPAFLWRYAGNGTLGVNIFFVLSGFLIYSLSAREVDKTGQFSSKQFYIRRILRIFPCFYFFIGVIVCLKWSGIVALSWQVLGSAATFTFNYAHFFDRWTTPADNADFGVIGHYWSLALEEQFYFTWPLLMLLFVRRKLLPVLMVIMCLAPFIRVASYYLAPNWRGQIGMMFQTGFDSIAAGVLLGELLRRSRPKALLQGLARNPITLYGAIAFILIISPLLNEFFKGAYEITVGKSLELACICVIVTAGVYFPETILGRLLNWRPMIYVGVLSYSLYVWNNLFLYSEGHWVVNKFPFNYLCVFGMAMFSHYLIEKPFLKLKDRFHKSAAASGKMATVVHATPSQ